jgi:hypothetical protein
VNTKEIGLANQKLTGAGKRTLSSEVLHPGGRDRDGNPLEGFRGSGTREINAKRCGADVYGPVEPRECSPGAAFLVKGG